MKTSNRSRKRERTGRFPILGILIWVAVYAVSLLILCSHGFSEGKEPLVVLAGQGIPLAALLALLWWVSAGQGPVDSHQILMLGTAFVLNLSLCLATGIASPYFMPVAYLGMLLSMTRDRTVAMTAHTVLTLSAVMMEGWGLDAAVALYAGGMAGICLARALRQRYSLMLIGLIMGVIQALIVTVFYLYQHGWAMTMLGNALWSLAGGMLSAVLLLGTLPLWENVFGMLTPYKLMELAGPNQPLIKRLLTEAPGTYHHSVMVANLAESAAEAVGADALLARVGAYYHDIGKLNNPMLFMENQGGDNPHDQMDPQESARLILAHVRDGLVLARQHRLPQAIRTFVAEHHGKTMVKYFYLKAREADPDTDEQKYRYPGPLPQTKESAIVMLADAVESAARSMRDAGWDRIRETVTALMTERMQEGQLDECDLTVAQVRQMQGLFLRALKSLYHERVKYPQQAEHAEVAK